MASSLAAVVWRNPEMFLKRQWKYPGISAECPEKALRVSGQDQASAAILFGINTADVQLNSGGRGLAAEVISIWRLTNQ